MVTWILAPADRCLLPPHYVVGMGKDGDMYLADINNMGHVGNFTQVFAAGSTGDTVGKSPVYWQGPDLQYIFALHSNSQTKSFEFTGTNIITTPLGTASFSHKRSLWRAFTFGQRNGQWHFVGNWQRQQSAGV